MNKYPDFFSVLFGKGPIGFFAGFIVVALVCAAVSMLIQVSNRDITSDRTPVKQSWKFFFADNILRIVANFLVIPIAIRAAYEHFEPSTMLFISIGIGFGVDKLGILAQKFGILTTNKIAGKIAEDIAPCDLKVEKL